MFKADQQVKFKCGFGVNWLRGRVIDSNQEYSLVVCTGFKMSINNDELFIDEPSLPFSSMMQNIKNRVLR